MPDSVRYTVQPLAWPAQDIRRLRSGVQERIQQAEQKLGLSLKPIAQQAAKNPLRIFFPRRSPETGKLLCDGALELDAPRHAFTIDYRATENGYPPRVVFGANRTGRVTALRWGQALCFNGQIVFENESLSWVETPCDLLAGAKYAVTLDDEWRKTNAHRIERA